MYLDYITPTPELIPDIHRFFDEQIHQLQWHGYSEEDIEWNCERNTIEKLQAKIADSVHYFEIVRDSDDHNRIIGYFESNAVWKEQEKQFIQWVFVHSEYTGKWIARKECTNRSDIAYKKSTGLRFIIKKKHCSL